MATTLVVPSTTQQSMDADGFHFDDIDLTTMSEAELHVLGIDPSEVEGYGEDPEEEESKEGEDAEEELEEDDEEESEEDTEEEDDEEELEEDAEEEDLEEDVPAKENRIPQSRFNEAVNKERAKVVAAEERSQELMAQVTQLLAALNKTSEEKVEATEPDYDFDGAEVEYVNAIIEGEPEKAAKIRNQINVQRSKEVNNLVKLAKQEARSEANAVSEQDRLKMVVSAAEAKHPELNASHENYDADLVDLVNATAVGLKTTKNISSAEAMEKAIAKLLKPTAKKAAPKKAAKVKKSPEMTKRRRAKAKAANAQPSKTPASSVKDTDPDSIDWEGMSEKEFDKLYESNPEIVQRYLKG